MLAWLASFLSGPIINGAIDAYKAKLASVDQHEEHAIELAKADLQAQIDARRQVTEMRKAEGAFGPLGILMLVFGLIVAGYFGKCVVWDTMLGLGETPPLYGAVATWANIVITGIFGVGGGAQVARIVASRFGK